MAWKPAASPVNSRLGAYSPRTTAHGSADVRPGPLFAINQPLGHLMQAMQTTSGAAATGPGTPSPLGHLYVAIRAATRVPADWQTVVDAVVALISRPGQATSAHDYTTWCAVAVIAGRRRDLPELRCGRGVRIGLEAAGGKNLEVFSATIGRQLLECGLIDEIDVHIAPVLLGDGIRFSTAAGAPPYDSSCSTAMIPWPQ